ncbi:YopX family protein [Schleiferilactobacillus harbinensis]|uniref:YopX family protein n=1 Tax=Schleiferilactobacillus harbinensis TaxID=304207 RepID=A0ABU7T0I3_9LACO
MKREIKFRVWDHNTDTMMIPDNFEFYDGEIGWIDASRKAGPGSGNDGYPDQFEIMQYTGLHDKNGREIYEGDIVKMHIVVLSPDDKVGRVEYTPEYGYSLLMHGRRARQNDWANDEGENYEVIGNIFENPELLEAQHD